MNNKQKNNDNDTKTKKTKQIKEKKQNKNKHTNKPTTKQQLTLHNTMNAYMQIYKHTHTKKKQQ